MPEVWLRTTLQFYDHDRERVGMMPTAELNSQELTEIRSAALDFHSSVSALEVLSSAEYEDAAEMDRRVGEVLKRIDELCDPITKATHTAWKAACDQKSKLADPFMADRKELRTRMLAYRKAVDRENERLRIEAERKRREAEAIARKAEEEKRLEAAARAEAVGENDLARQILDSEPAPAVEIFAPVPVVEAPKTDGQVIRKRYKGEVFDLRALVIAASGDNRWLGLLEVNQSAVDALARSLRENFSIPGIRLKIIEEIAQR